MSDSKKTGLFPTPRTSDVRSGRILNDKGQRTNKDGTMTYGANLADKVNWTPPDKPHTISLNLQSLNTTELYK